MDIPEEKRIVNESIAYIKQNRKLLCSKFANLKAFPSTDRPFSIFMAGSPGAGKTEFSTSFIKNFIKIDEKIKVVRIDADEIRKILPHFNGKNSYLVQPAAALGVEKLYDHVQDKKQNVIVDSTFADYKIAHSNVKRAIDKNRRIGIIYLYQDPLIAWDFTKKREVLEGRYVPKNMFIDSFFGAKENVNKIKVEFGRSVMLSLVVKDFQNKVEKTKLNIDQIDSFLKISYNKKDLYNALK